MLSTDLGGVVPVAPVVVNVIAAPPAAVQTVVVSDGGIVVEDPTAVRVTTRTHFSATERLAILAAIVVGLLMALTIAPIRLALLILSPVPVLVYAWCLYAGEPGGSRLWNALGNSLPGAAALSSRQRRALTVLLVGGGVWAAVFLLHQFAGAHAPGPFI